MAFIPLHIIVSELHHHDPFVKQVAPCEGEFVAEVGETLRDAVTLNSLT
jgi:hypothetical protein